MATAPSQDPDPSNGHRESTDLIEDALKQSIKLHRLTVCRFRGGKFLVVVRSTLGLLPVTADDEFPYWEGSPRSRPAGAPPIHFGISY